MGMMGKESFEDKIRQQLENYEVPYKKSYWKSYVATFPAPRIAFWKSWWLPYLFSSLLFGVAWFWFGRDVQPIGAVADVRDTVVVQHTLVTRDTLVIRDTVVLFVREKSLAQREALSVVADNGKKDSVTDSLPKLTASSATVSSKGDLNANRTSSLAAQQNSSDQIQLQSSEVSLSDGETAKRVNQDRNAARDSASYTDESSIISQNPDEQEVSEAVDSLEQAYLEEDLKNSKLHKKQSEVFFSAGPRISSLSPFDYGNFDTRYGGFVGGAVQVEWRKWQIETGVQLGMQNNEIDDLSLVPQSQKLRFPGYANLTTEPDEIGVTSLHLLVPVQLRYTVYDYQVWRFQVAGGVMGNLILTESFKYHYDLTDRDFVNRTRTGRDGLSLSHLNVGLGTSYAWNQNIELQAILNYYHPLRPLGLNELRVGALSLQLGMSWLINR